MNKTSQRAGVKNAAPHPFPPVLDACCGSRMFWFDHRNPYAVFIDKRRETVVADTREGRRVVLIHPDIIADFTSLPFDSGYFSMVVFDPPHLKSAGPKSWQAKKYGRLGKNFLEELGKGFAECFRVLKPFGVLIFKWNEHQIPVSQILSLTPVQPLFGNRCGKASKSHWIVFMKTDL